MKSSFITLKEINARWPNLPKKIKHFYKCCQSYRLYNGFVGIELAKCPYCNNEHLKEINHETIEVWGTDTVCEYDYYCENCDKAVGHWAFGVAQPNREDQIKKKRK